MKEDDRQKTSRFDFDSLYLRYPRKEGRKLGMARLKKTIKTQAEYDAFAFALDQYIKLCASEGRGLKFVKHWSTFVNNWTDYIQSDLSVQVDVAAEQLTKILKGDL